MIIIVPNFNPINFHCGIFSIPCRIPVWFIRIKLIYSITTFIRPWLRINSICEISINSSNSYIHQKIIFWVKRSTVISSLPNIIIIRRKSSSLPHRFIRKIELQYSISISINICIQFIFIPNQSKYMEIISKCSICQVILLVG